MQRQRQRSRDERSSSEKKEEETYGKLQIAKRVYELYFTFFDDFFPVGVVPGTLVWNLSILILL